MTAIVTGANGMGGHHMLQVLLSTPDRWTKIYCLSRKPPSNSLDETTDGIDSRVEHVVVDFLSSADKVASVLRDRQIKASVASKDREYFETLILAG